MFETYSYTKTELDKLLKSIVVLCDTREKENTHIIDFFDTKKISYINATLGAGDYTFMLPANPDLGIIRDMYFHNNIVVERKGSLEELSGNLAQERQRFEDEFLRCRAKIILMVENGSYDKILDHKYRTQLNEKTYMGSLLTFHYRYGVTTQFIDKQHAGQFIYSTFYYYLREYIKNGGPTNG